MTADTEALRALERLENILRDPLSGLVWAERIDAADAIAELIRLRADAQVIRALLRAGCDLMSVDVDAHPPRRSPGGQP